MQSASLTTVRTIVAGDRIVKANRAAIEKDLRKQRRALA